MAIAYCYKIAANTMIISKETRQIAVLLFPINLDAVNTGILNQEYALISYIKIVRYYTPL